MDFYQARRAQLRQFYTERQSDGQPLSTECFSLYLLLLFILNLTKYSKTLIFLTLLTITSIEKEYTDIS